MEANTYIAVLRKGWKYIAACGVLGALIALAFSFAMTPQYRATTTLYFSLQGGDSTSQILEGSTFAQNQVQSFALLADKPAVLQPVIDELGLALTPEQLSKQVSTNAQIETVLLDVSATSPNPTQAAAIANSTARSLTAAIDKLEGGATSGNVPRVRSSIVAEAQVPLEPYSPNKKLNALGGLALGLVIGATGVVLRALLDTKVRDEERVHSVTTTPVIGSVAQDTWLDSGKKTADTSGDRGQSQGLEAFRRLRSSVEYLGYDGGNRMIAVSSPSPGDGKSTVAINLARAFAENSRVLLIDTDLRKPSVGAKLGLEEAVGLSGVLINQYGLDEAVQRLGRGNLDVLASGDVPPNPAELLGSPAMARLLEMARERYEWVFLDTPPLLPVSDPALVGKQADGMLVVVNTKATTVQHLKQALRILEMTGVQCLGLILNRVPGSSTDYYYRREEQSADGPLARIQRTRSGKAGIAGQSAPIPAMPAPTGSPGPVPSGAEPPTGPA